MVNNVPCDVMVDALNIQPSAEVAVPHPARSYPRRFGANVLRYSARFLRRESGNMAALFALTIIPLLGAASMAIEVSNWYLTGRALQNTADSAVMAAAANGSTTSFSGTYDKLPELYPSYKWEALSVAQQLGYINGENNVVITVVNGQTCPSGTATNCYKVTLQKTLPIYLAMITGYTGDPGAGGKLVTASAMASSSTSSNRTYCVLSLVSGDGSAASSSTVGITTKGNSSSNPTGCYAFSDGSTSCTGAGNHPLAQYVDAVGTSDTSCVPKATPQNATSNATPITDTTYRNLQSNIPTSGTCSINTISEANAVLSADKKSATLTLAASTFCTGDIKVNFSTKTVATLNIATPATTSGGSVLFINNGTFNTNGYTIQTTSGSGLAMVFTGTTGSSKQYPTGGGTLDMAAPKSGTWSGVALYQNPNITASATIDMSAAGNSPTWYITGLLYFPNANISLGGSINKATNGVRCIALVDKTFSVNGGAGFYPSDPTNTQTDCSTAGLTPPTGTLGSQRFGLVQ